MLQYVKHFGCGRNFVEQGEFEMAHDDRRTVVTG
jgi:hypothetical protein